MRKKIVLFIFTLFVSLLFVNGASARNYEIKCVYDNIPRELANEKIKRYEITFELIGDSLTMKNCTNTYGNGACDFTLEPTFFDRKSCPVGFSIEENKMIIKHSLEESYYMYHEEWYCKYSITDHNFLQEAYDFLAENFSFGYYDPYKSVGLVINYVNNVHGSANGFVKSSYLVVDGEIYEQGFKEKFFLDPAIHNDLYKNDFDDEGCLDLYVIKPEDELVLTFDAGLLKIEGDLIKYDSNEEITDTGASNCLQYSAQSSCVSDLNVACVWVDSDDYDFIEEGYCNVDNLLYVGCGGASDIPIQVPSLIAFIVNALKIVTPIILIFISVITLLKALSSQKEDEIKKATSSLIKKLIAAAMVFFIVSIVQFIVSKVAKDDVEYADFSNCLSCFLNNDCEINAYYRTVISGEDYCTYLATGKKSKCSDLYK